jgi:hypothetical protein
MCFDGASPSMVEILILTGEERRQWMIAGARGLYHLVAPPLKFMSHVYGCLYILYGCECNLVS